METNGKPEMTKEQFLHELGELMGNAALSTRGLGWFDSFDRKRRIDEDCDYPPTGIPVGVDYYKELYEREAIAARVVEVLPRESWQGTPRIADNAGDGQTPTDFEEAVTKLGIALAPGGGPSWHKELHGSALWEKLLRLDILSGIGQFGAMLLGLDDGLNLQDPVVGSTVLLTNSAGESYEMPDSPASDEELAYLRKLAAGPVPRKSWTHNEKLPSGEIDPQFRDVNLPSLNGAERRIVAQWAEQREVYSAFERMRGTDPVANAAETEKPLVEKWMGIHNKYVEKFADLLPGTDRQYYEAGSLGMGMARAKGASLQGTDQQYMGVQFGPSEAPSDTPRKKGLKLLFVRCFDESLVQIVRWEWNVNNPRFGQPVMYRMTLNDPRQIYSGVGLPLATVFVHWTRVIHVPCVDFKQNSEVLSTPRMQQCLNRLIDIRKVSAAGAEGYWQSCFAAISLETNPQLGGDVKLDYTGLEQMMSDFRLKLRRDIVTSGLTAKTLPPSVVDPGPYANNAIQQICIRLAVPNRVFIGSERGELASSQDDAQWNDVIRSRQELHVTPDIVCPFIDRLILLGVLPEPKEGYRVEWPDLDSLNDKDKAALAVTIVQALSAYIAGNVESKLPFKIFLLKAFDGYFTAEEIDTIIDESEKFAEQQIAEKQALADQHGFTPAAPSGFKNPEPEPGAPSPIKLREGETLVHPDDVKPTGNANPNHDERGRFAAAGMSSIKDDPASHTHDDIRTHIETLKGLPGTVVKSVAQIVFGQTHPTLAATKGKGALIEEMSRELHETKANHERMSRDFGINSFCPTGPGGGIDATCSPGVKGEGTKENPYRCGADIKTAAKLLSQGHHIELAQPDQVATLLDKMQKYVKQGKDFDLCKVSSPGTNLFCQENIDVPRVNMPQMRGMPVPGSYAATKDPVNKAGKVDLSSEFIAHMREEGIKSEQIDIRASHLRASQNQIVGSRITELMGRTANELREKPIFVTKDNYVVDGHHHWAALVGKGYEAGKDYKVPVHRLNCDIGTALRMANEFTKTAGLAPKSGST
jgi:hypothetical protein